MTTYLKIENPGVCPPEGFTLLGASTKRNSNYIGRFGSGNKHAINTCLRAGLNPVIFCSNLKLEFGTRSQDVSDHSFNRVFVKYQGKDEDGKNRSYSEDLGYVLEYGVDDWQGVYLGLREFVSNSIDESSRFEVSNFLSKLIVNNVPQHEIDQRLKERQLSATDWDKVVVELVNENQVRAKSGCTRVFIPVNDDVLNFKNNLGKWFLHFNEPHLLNKSIFTKNNRNISEKKSAVIFRRGVRVREFEHLNLPSLFDYNIESLRLDESRQVNDWSVKDAAAKEIATTSDPVIISRFVQSIVSKEISWELTFDGCSLANSNGKNQKIWENCFLDIAGEESVVVHAGNAYEKINLEKKGYNPIEIPYSYMELFREFKIPTPEKLLSTDDLQGRKITDPTPDALAAFDYIWDQIVRLNMHEGKEKPSIHGYDYILNSGSMVNGFYRDSSIYINNSMGGSSSTLMLKVVTEEIAHYVTGSLDCTRDFQDYAFNLFATLCSKNMKGNLSGI
jgi:hypothetical protein